MGIKPDHQRHLGSPLHLAEQSEGWYEMLGVRNGLQLKEPTGL